MFYDRYAFMSHYYGDDLSLLTDLDAMDNVYSVNRIYLY